MNVILRSLLLAVFAVQATLQLFAQESGDRNQRAHIQVYLDKDKIQLQIKQLVEAMGSGKVLNFDGDFIFSGKVLPEFYKNRNYMPAWGNYTVLTAAIEALELAWQDGLNPDDYHAASIRKVVEQLEESLGSQHIDYQKVACFDLLVTDALLLYAYHLLEGKVDPKSLDPIWNYSFREIYADAPARLQQAITVGNLGEALHALRPQIPVYESYRQLLVQYRQLEQEGGWKSISGGKTIKPGESDERIPTIRQRLAKTGDLSTGADQQSLVYDEGLQADLKHFQRLNGLDDDGVIGPGTLRLLNQSASERVAKLRVNMERARWVVANLSNRFIVVNIPAYRAYYVQDKSVRFITKVQVGKPYSKTPVFKSKLGYIEFNPTWTVPRSIIRSSIIPHLKKDPAYLGKNHFDLLDMAGNKLDPSGIDFSGANASNFPYMVRQQPGKWNSLGVVKFIFPNDYAVYLHDTPSKALFERSERAFSHGCIRTQNPLQLAELLLEGTQWNKAKIDALIQSGETKRINPPAETDVLLLYWTVGYVEGKELGFFNDVYNLDGKVLAQLNKKTPTVAKRKVY
ncbi:MAG: murein L,D-transpeptidase [Mangrovibacterium sp.]